MKRIFWCLVALSACTFSCNDDDGPTVIDDTSDQAITGRDASIRPQSFNNISLVDLNADIEIDEAMSNGEVRLTSDSDMDGEIDYYVDNGVLYLEGNEDDGVVIYTNPDNVRKLIVRGNYDTHISGSPLLDDLEIVTEGNSVLYMDHIRVRNLNTTRQGGSKMYLSSRMDDPDTDTLYFDEADVLIVDNTYVIYTDNDIDYLLYAPELEIEDGEITVYQTNSDRFIKYFLINSHTMRNQGNSYLDAFELPTVNAYSRNLGTSKANVWVATYLEVEGVGNSELNYIGNPSTQLDLRGQAEVNKVD